MIFHAEDVIKLLKHFGASSKMARGGSYVSETEAHLGGIHPLKKGPDVPSMNVDNGALSTTGVSDWKSR